MNLDPKELDADNHKWMLGQMRLESGTLLVRLNETAKNYVAHPELGIKLGFAIPFNSEPVGGMPNPEENDVLNLFEDQVIETVASNAVGIHVLTLTAPHVKELVFYIAENADIGSMHEQLQATSASHEVQCMAVREPDWGTFLDYLPRSLAE